MRSRSARKKGAPRWVGEFRMDQPLGRGHLGMVEERVVAPNATLRARRRRRWVGDNGSMARRTVVNRKNAPELHSTNSGVMTPLGNVARMLMKEVLKAKNKTKEGVKP